mmetsp:Transcript_50583/g.142512  ORF Transcript_50583/g.142512 Transcript_50583/m.142512 type:complete len:207 (+) Transcript_50583:383-1003(+)
MAEETLRSDFGECGKVEAVRMLKNADGSFKGTAFVVFAAESAVESALAWNGEWYMGDRIIVRRAGGADRGAEKGKGKGRGKGEGRGRGKGEGKGEGKQAGKAWNSDHDRTVFVGSVYPDATEEELRSDFARFGEVEKVRMLYDKADGWFKGAAFLVFRSQDSADKSLEWDGHSHRGRSLKVSKLGASGEGKGKGAAKKERKYLDPG